MDSWSGREVFAHPEYLGLHQEVGQRPICAVYRSPEGRVIYPLIIRDLRTCPFWGGEREEIYDTISAPYGYGGPFVQGGQDASKLVTGFFQEYEKWALSPPNPFSIPRCVHGQDILPSTGYIHW